MRHRDGVLSLSFLLLSGSLLAQDASVRIGGEPGAGGPRRSPPRTAVADTGEGSYPRGMNAEAPANPQQTTFTDADGFTHWKQDVNVGCSFSDHSYTLSITEDPADLSDISYSMTNFDVDYGDPQGCPGGAEVDRMVWNGTFLGILTGANNSWSINSYPLSRDKMVNGSNTIYIDTDSTGTGCWCVGVGYVEVKAKVRFHVKKHDPQKDDKNRDFHAGKLDLKVEFTHEYEPSTLTANTFKLEYKDAGGARQQVAGNFQQVAPTTFKFTPAADLKGGVRYYVTVKGGVNGVKKKDDTGQLPNDKTWEFWTVPDLNLTDAFSSARSDSGRDSLVPDAGTTCVPKSASPCQGLEVAVHQVTRNADLVPGKRTTARVFHRWKKLTDVLDADQVDQMETEVDLGTFGSQVATVKRPDKYQDADRKAARTSVNFHHDGTATTTYTAKTKPKPQSNATPVEYTRNLALGSKAASTMTFDHYYIKAGDWAGGVPAAAKTAAVALLDQGKAYTKSQFPVTGVSYTVKGDLPIGYTFTGTTGDGGKQRNVNCPTGATTTVMFERSCIFLHMAPLRGAKSLVSATVPGAVKAGVTGTGTSGQKALILYHGNGPNAGTVAHEIGHVFGLSTAGDCGGTAHRCTHTALEGFDPTGRKNKSATELCDASPCADLVSLMDPFLQPVDKQWNHNGDYADLLGKAYTRPVAGTYLVVSGAIDPNVPSGVIATSFTSPDAPSTVPGSYVLELLNGSGTVLSSASFGLPELIEDQSRGHSVTAVEGPQPFSVGLTWNTAAQTLRLRSGATVLASLAKTAAVPVVAFTSPGPNAILTGPQTVSWTVTDADSSVVWSQLQYSTDGGVTFSPLSGLLPQTSVTVDTSMLPSGVNFQIRVQATDGFNEGTALRGVSFVNPLKVIATVPEAAQTGVSSVGPIQITFSSSVAFATLQTGFYLTKTGVPAILPGTLQYSTASRTATFLPNDPLESSASYTFTLLGTVSDTSGNTIGGSGYTSSFTTAADTEGPVLVAKSPPGGAINVPLNPAVVAQFDEPLNAATVTGSSMQLLGPGAVPVAGAVTYNAVGQQAVFVPTSNLAASTTYTARVTTGIQDVAGNPLAANEDWSFTTGTAATPQTLRIVGNYLDVARDNELDGKYDALDLWTDVEVRATDTYNLNGRLDTSAGDLIEWQSAGFFNLSPGVYSIPLTFSSAAIRNSGANGPYLLNALNFYANSNPVTLSDSRSNAFATSPYNLADFYSIMTLSGLPDQLVEKGTTRNDAFNLRALSTHQSQPVTSLTYTIFSNTDPAVGVSIDASTNIDINPGAGVEAESDVTIEAKDTLGNRALSTFHVGVQAAKASVLTGVSAPKRMAPGTTQTISFDVFDQFARLFTTPTLVSFQATQGTPSPTSATTSNGRASTDLTVPNAVTTLFLTATAGGASSQLTVDVNKIGDVNGDNVVDVFDTVVMSNQIVGNVVIGVPPFLGVFTSGDFDGNAVIDLFDLVRLANCIVGNGC